MFRLFFFLFLAGTACAQQITTETDVEYGRVNGKALLLDISRPAEKADRPRAALIIVHGGGWVAGDKRDMRGFAEAAARQGYVCFNVDYRLTFGGENQWPAALDDTQRAVRWVRANAAKYSIDPQRIGALGASAGGHLAAFLGTVDTRDNSDATLAAFSSRVQCVVDLFGPTNLGEDFSNQERLGPTANSLVKTFLGGSGFQEKLATAREASPLLRVDAKSAPFLIFHGAGDDLVPPSQSERLDAALKKAGVESKLILFEGEGHGFKKKESQERLTREVQEFFKKHLLETPNVQR